MVRLKGGDPFVFGRGGEESAFLAEQGIDVEIVPGITAAVGAAAYAGVPLTHRDHASAVTFVTGHGKNGEPDLDWAHLATARQTVVIYMGVETAARTAARLLEHGMAPDMPVAVIENATRPDQRIVTGPVSRLGHLVAEHGITGPALLVIYLQLHAYMLRVAIHPMARSRWTWKADARAGRDRPALRQGLRPFHEDERARTSSSTGPSWSEAPDILAAGRGRDARHPDQRQLHPQRHRRSLAGVAADEIEDPRIYAEIIRQWSTLHPEFSFLPRKFKIAVTGAEQRPGRRAVCTTSACDGPQPRRRARLRGDGRRRPGAHAGDRQDDRADFLPERHLLSYLEAILRVYNQFGRRDNLYKARIKILVDADRGSRSSPPGRRRNGAHQGQRPRPAGAERPAHQGPFLRAATLPAEGRPSRRRSVTRSHRSSDPDHAAGWATNVDGTSRGYAIVRTISLKDPCRQAPGDAISAEQMEAGWPTSPSRLRSRRASRHLERQYEQNLRYLPSCARRGTRSLAAICGNGILGPAPRATRWRQSGDAECRADLDDIIACPGLDYCNLANARSHAGRRAGFSGSFSDGPDRTGSHDLIALARR